MVALEYWSYYTKHIINGFVAFKVEEHMSSNLIEMEIEIETCLRIIHVIKITGKSKLETVKKISK